MSSTPPPPHASPSDVYPWYTLLRRGDVTSLHSSDAVFLLRDLYSQLCGWVLGFLVTGEVRDKAVLGQCNRQAYRNYIEAKTQRSDKVLSGVSKA